MYQLLFNQLYLNCCNAIILQSGEKLCNWTLCKQERFETKHSVKDWMSRFKFYWLKYELSILLS